MGFLQARGRRGDRVLCLARDEDFPLWRDLLADFGVEVAARESSGELTFLSLTPNYLRDGDLDAARLLADLGERAEQARPAGAALRVCADLTGALPDGEDFRPLREFEYGVAQRAAAGAVTCLCLYAAERLPNSLLGELLLRHRLVVLGGSVYPNPYCLPGGEAGRGEGEDRIAVRMLEAVERHLTRESSVESTRLRYSYLLANLPGMAYSCCNDRHWTMKVVSQGCRELTGYEPEALVENREVAYAALIQEEDRPRVWETVQASLSRHEPFQMEYGLRTAGGEEKWVWEQGRGAWAPSGELLDIHGLVVDITAHRANVEALHRANRARRALAECNRALAQASTEPELLTGICTALVREAGFPLVWVAKAESDAHMSVVASAGPATGYAEELQAAWLNPGQSRGPTAQALRSGQPAFCRSFAAATENPARENALRYGLASSISVPVLGAGGVWGSLNLYSEREDAFDEEEVALLVGLAADLSWGLEVLQIRRERDLAEVWLRESESRYRELVEKANSIILKMDAAGRVTFLNDFAERFFGFAREELLGRSVLGTIVPETESTGRDLRALIDELCTEPEKYQTCLNENTTKDGRRVWVNWINHSVYGADGELSEIYSVAHDWTERREAEEQLRRSHQLLEQAVAERTAELQQANVLLQEEIVGHESVHAALCESEAKYRDLVDDLGAAILQVDREGVITFLNAGAEQLLGFSAGEVVGQRAVGLMWAAPPDGELDLMQKLFREGEPCSPGEWLTWTKDGSALWVAWTSRLQYDEAGQVVGLLAVGHDVTEQRLAREQVGHRDQLLRAMNYAAGCFLQPADWLETLNRVLERVGEAVGVTRMGVYQNYGTTSGERRARVAAAWTLPEGTAPAGQALSDLRLVEFGLGRWEETLGAGGTVAPRREDLPVAEAAAAAAAGLGGAALAPITVRGSWWGWVYFQDHRQARRWTEADLEALHTCADLIASSVLRRQAREQLEQTVEDLERSNVELEQFAYIASHDLQEPLRMVMSYVQLLEQEFGGVLGEEGREYLEFAVEGTQRMHRLVKDLLGYSRVGSRRQPLVSCDCGRALQEALANLGPALNETHAEVAADGLPTVQADAGQLSLLFQNLIGNAVKFRGDEAPRVRIAACPEGDKWRFTVQDNGIGIEPAYLERIFTIFERLHTTEEYPGTGVGLAVCKKIVERHGGRIWVESEYGKGSIFNFTMPANSGEGL